MVSYTDRIPQLSRQSFVSSWLILWKIAARPLVSGCIAKYGCFLLRMEEVKFLTKVVLPPVTLFSVRFLVFLTFFFLYFYFMHLALQGSGGVVQTMAAGVLELRRDLQVFKK